MKQWPFALSSLLAVACGSQPPAASPQPTSEAAATPAEADEPAPPAEEAAAAPDETATAAATEPGPLVPAKTWPFVEWDRAVAATYNLHVAGPSGSILAYSEKQGLSAAIKNARDISAEQAGKALALLEKTHGEMMVSRCAYPRHAVILYAGDRPVASINVCFECGDILIDPPYDRDPAAEQRKREMMGKLMKVYDRTFPQWKSFFETDLGLASDWKKLPGAELP
jgi:hypothetical protein